MAAPKPTITWIPSPNFTKGRTQKVKKCIVHWMVGTLASTDSVFKNPSSGVSAHYGVENDKIHQYVKESDTAWHAISANPFSIGIEHSATPDRPASEATYRTSAKLIARICKRYNLDPDTAIEPHKKYVATQCPGTLSVVKLKQLVKAELAEEMVTLQGLNVIYRFLLGKAASDYGKETYLGKVSFDTAYQKVRDSKSYQALVNNPTQVVAKEHLPKELRG